MLVKDPPQEWPIETVQHLVFSRRSLATKPGPKGPQFLVSRSYPSRCLLTNWDSPPSHKISVPRQDDPPTSGPPNLHTGLPQYIFRFVSYILIFSFHFWVVLYIVFLDFSYVSHLPHRFCWAFYGKCQGFSSILLRLTEANPSAPRCVSAPRSLRAARLAAARLGSALRRYKQAVGRAWGGVAGGLGDDHIGKMLVKQ